MFEDIGLYFLVFTAAPNNKLQVISAETKSFIRKSRFAVGAVSSVYRLKRLENEKKKRREDKRQISIKVLYQAYHENN